ncbi:MAG: hemolysin family protein [Deltaproteobacteria bacterium]|nr:hemolysin family protein [Kofleriaceae bacterium]
MLVLANGLFAGAEIAILSVRAPQLASGVRAGDRSALAVKTLRDRPERFLATVQIGITVIGAAAGAFGGATLAEDLALALAGLGAGAYANDIAFALVIALISWLSLVFGELVPKSLALRFSRTYAYSIARPLLGLSSLMRPLVWFLTACSNVVLRVFGDRTTFTESRLSRDELRQLVEDAAKVGSVTAHSGEIAMRALGFDDVRVAELVVPRNQVTAVRRGAPAEEIRRLLLEEGHNRMPVYDGDLDHVVGYIVARDFLSLAWESDLIVFDDILRPAYFVDAGARAVDVLRELQRRHIQMAIVTSEQRDFLGLVTIEDLLEEIVGDIFSETEQGDAAIRWDADGSVVLPGTVQVRRVNRALGLHVPVGPDRTTMAGVCIALALGIPAPGQRLVCEDGTRLEVVDATARRVRRVRVFRGEAPDRPPPDQPA